MTGIAEHFQRQPGQELSVKPGEPAVRDTALQSIYHPKRPDRALLRKLTAPSRPPGQPLR